MRCRRVFSALVVVLLALFAYESYIYSAGPVYAHTRMMQEMMGLPTPFLGLSLRSWTLLVLLSIFAFSLSTGKREESLEILAARYARGEISREEYLQGLRDLKEGR
ncbi:MAG: SHOCT domain-containing protein [Euryarchaeota archaeon]|nr:SHOCT domain-containing protein [Euryarchaeota archaeon]